MFFTIQRKQYENLKALLSALPIPNHYIMESSYNTLIEVKDGSIFLTRINGNRRLTVNGKLEGEMTDGSFCIPSYRFDNIPLRGDVIEFQSDDKLATIKCGTYKGTVSGLDVNSFPKKPDTEFYKSVLYNIPSDLIATGINKVKGMISGDDTRKSLQGIYVSYLNSEFIVAAADGKIIGEFCKKQGASDDTASSIIMPSETFIPLYKLCALAGNSISATMADNGSIEFKSDSFDFISSTIKEKYPAYRKFIPASYKHVFKLKRSDVLQATNSAISVFDKADELSEVDFEFKDNSIIFHAKKILDGGENTDTVSYDKISDDIPDFIVQFNSKFLLECMRGIFDEFIMEFNGYGSPVHFRDDQGFQCVVVPMVETKKIQEGKA